MHCLSLVAVCGPCLRPQKREVRIGGSRFGEGRGEGEGTFHWRQIELKEYKRWKQINGNDSMELSHHPVGTLYLHLSRSLDQNRQTVRKGCRFTLDIGNTIQAIGKRAGIQGILPNE